MYGGSRHLSLVGRRLTSNQVLASTIWFFMIVWVETWKAIQNIKGTLEDTYEGGGGQLGYFKLEWHGRIVVKT